MSDQYSRFIAILETAKPDFDKFYGKEVNAAGGRVRKHLQELAKLCKEVRTDVTTVKNARQEAKATK
jgi:hypothetical protein